MKPGSTAIKESSQADSLMMKLAERQRFDKMILIAGDGRNVGKTTFAMKIIRQLSVQE